MINVPNKIFSIQVDRNLRGKEAEKIGDIELAIQLYEQNVKERFQGNHPYDRLSVIYRGNKMIDEEIRVIKTAIDVFEKDVNVNRPDRDVKLERFKDRLGKAYLIKGKF